VEEVKNPFHKSNYEPYVQKDTTLSKRAFLLQIKIHKINLKTRQENARSVLSLVTGPSGFILGKTDRRCPRLALIG
jgi:hypothetical protein